MDASLLVRIPFTQQLIQLLSRFLKRCLLPSAYRQLLLAENAFRISL